MAESYIATLSADFDPERYSSDYREALEALVEAKSEGIPMPEVEEQEPEARGRRPGGRLAGERRRRQEASR